MKQKSKIVMSIVAAFIGGSVAAMAMNKVLVPDKHHLTFNEAFQQNPKSKVGEMTVSTCRSDKSIGFGSSCCRSYPFNKKHLR
jgi:hypothetical protein